MGSYFICLGKYATFSGRSTRMEFWGYNIVNAILVAALAYFYLNAGKNQTIATTVFVIYVILTICPTLAVLTRRWHDIGRTGKWLLLNLVPVVGTVVSYCFMLTQGEEGTNEYGRDPRERRYRKRNRRR